VSPEPELACFSVGLTQLPVAFGDDFDIAVGDLDRGLIVDHVSRA
jgi:hypothetical protein